MLSSQRKQQILKILAAENQVMSGELSQRFGISEDSIRRDLRELAAEGLLQRVHGGALPVSAALASFENAKRANEFQAVCGAKGGEADSTRSGSDY